MSRLLVSVAAIALFAYPAEAQIVMGNGGPGGGTGTVSSITAGNGILVNPSPITSTGTVATTDVLGNSGAAVTGTTYAVQATDGAKEVLFTGTGASAWTLASPATFGGQGFAFRIVNAGTATVTLTATGNIVTGNTSAATSAVAAGATIDVFNDGTTWYAVPYAGSGSSGFPITLGTTSIASGSTTTSIAGISIASGSSNTIATAGSIIGGSTITATTALTAGSTSTIGFTGRSVITSPATGDIQIGPANSGAPAAQSITFPSGLGTNIAGNTNTIQASLGSGNAAQGNLIFQVGTPTTSGAGYGATIAAETISGGTGQVNFGGGIVSASQTTIPTATGTATPTVTTGSTDAAGSVTPGTAGTSVIITSGNAGYTTAPFCVVQPVTQLVAFTAPVTVGTVTAGHWTISVTQTASTGLITWHCWKNT